MSRLADIPIPEELIARARGGEEEAPENPAVPTPPSVGEAGLQASMDAERRSEEAVQRHEAELQARMEPAEPPTAGAGIVI